MAEWNRKTPWRQGRLLPKEATSALNLSHVELPASQPAVVVISHDCDLAANPEIEPNVEAIVGRLIEKPDGNCAYAKNARVLHVPFVSEDQKQWVELTATEKLIIRKNELASFVPRSDLILDDIGHSILQQWLAARYRRAAFPDGFDRRLGRKGFSEKLRKIIKPSGEHIRAVFFDLEQHGEEIPDDSAETYVLTIYVLYTTDSDPELAEATAENVCMKIKEVFRENFLKPTQRWKDIELRDCIALADEALTYVQSTLFKQWGLEHLSLRENPPHPML